MIIVAIGWLYVVVLMSFTEPSVLAGLATFFFYGAAPLALVLYVMGMPARRRKKKRLREVTQADAAAREKS